jgi:hypothetical protein
VAQHSRSRRWLLSILPPGPSLHTAIHWPSLNLWICTSLSGESAGLCTWLRDSIARTESDSYQVVRNRRRDGILGRLSVGPDG